MKKYDVLVIGAGDTGLAIAFNAAYGGLKVALIDKGSLGGTCVNTGCVPSKTLIHTADRIMETRENSRLGIRSEILDIDFNAVMGRMRTAVTGGIDAIKSGIRDAENIDFISSECHFVDGQTVLAGGKKFRGKKLFIASGARPSVPEIRGLESVRYLTNETVLGLDKRPSDMLFIGGGYIALEYAHFFSALGVKVTIVDRNPMLLRFGEPEISETLQKALGKRVELHLGVTPVEIQNEKNRATLLVKETATGREFGISAEEVMVSAGRRPNSDLLKPENAGIETDEAGFIKVDDYLQTNRKNIWAIGDANGRAMFTHAGDKEAELAWHNATHRKKLRMDFQSVPYAVYTWPQIASVGLTEAQARKEHEVLVGRARYSDTVMGEAMAETEGFAKAVVEKDTNRILGFHIVGPHAAILIQEVVNAIAAGGDVKSITGSMHIFPALSNIVPDTFSNLE